MFQTFGPDGSLQIDSNQKVVVCGPTQQVGGYNPGIGGGALYIVNRTGTRTLFNAMELDRTGSYWIQFVGNGAATLGMNLLEERCALYLEAGLAVNIRRANDTNAPHGSGYLDVLNAAGQITWSASDAYNGCNILGQQSLDYNAGITGGAVAYMAGNPWIMLNQFITMMFFANSTNTTLGGLIQKNGDAYSLFSGWGANLIESYFRDSYGGTSTSAVFCNFPY